MRLRVEDITPVMKVKNEDYWIWYVLRDVMQMFGRFIILDTGSTDRTKEIARSAAERFNADLTLIEKNYGDDAEAIGNSPNILRVKCPTHWMFLVDGDEIWRTEQLERLLAADIPEDQEVLMVTGRNLAADKKGEIKMREAWNADRLFAPCVRWTRTHYPFESHFLEERCERGVVSYVDATFWHTRHLVRSSRDDEAFFRDEKRNYFPYDGPLYNMPPDWLGEIAHFTNPYLGVA